MLNMCVSKLGIYSGYVKYGVLNLKYVQDMLSMCVPKPEICSGYVKYVCT